MGWAARGMLGVGCRRDARGGRVDTPQRDAAPRLVADSPPLHPTRDTHYPPGRVGFIGSSDRGQEKAPLPMVAQRG